ncbi:MAG: hypothetical protein FWD64_05345 [Acidobacteriaceae bacterium]|nr:hypothetical protein [Acidobacteriaceae bacterium]
MGTMKILMLGYRDAGKTTYMASAYGMLKRGVKGFYVKGSDDDDSWLSGLYQSICQGRYPLLTDKRGTFKMDLYYYAKLVLPFEWVDYYGGVITEEKSAQLLTDMDESDGLMMFFEAPALVNGNENVTQLRRMLYLVAKKLITLQDYFTVIVVLTKCDLLSPGISVDEASAALSKFVSSADGNEKIYLRVVPVSCTARGFANVDLPLLDILDSGLQISCLQIAQKVQQAAVEAVERASNIGFFDWAFSRIAGVETNGEIATRRAKEANEQLDLFQSLKTPMEELSEYVSSYQVQLPESMAPPNDKQHVHASSVFDI